MKGALSLPYRRASLAACSPPQGGAVAAQAVAPCANQARGNGAARVGADLFVEEALALLFRHHGEQLLRHGVHALESFGASVADLAQAGVAEVYAIDGVALLGRERELAVQHLRLLERLLFGRAGGTELLLGISGDQREHRYRDE